jgi:hypothetical protein
MIEVSGYYVSSYYYMCPHTTIYMSSYYFMRAHTRCMALSTAASWCRLYQAVLMLLFMCPHTTIFVSSCYFMCPHTRCLALRLSLKALLRLS